MAAEAAAAPATAAAAEAGGEGATENRSFFAASFWIGEGATENRSVFFGDAGASSSWTTGVTGPLLAALNLETTSGRRL